MSPFHTHTDESSVGSNRCSALEGSHIIEWAVIMDVRLGICVTGQVIGNMRWRCASLLCYCPADTGSSVSSNDGIPLQ